eukprot:297846-Chlamydomonas_euryale.AAC.24
MAGLQSSWQPSKIHTQCWRAGLHPFPVEPHMLGKPPSHLRVCPGTWLQSMHTAKLTSRANGVYQRIAWLP